MSTFAFAKAIHIFSAKIPVNLELLSRTANIFTTTWLVKSTMLSTTGPRTLDKILKGLDTPGSFSTTFYKGDNFYSVCLLF